MIKFKRLSLIDKKQPQEFYCSSHECINEVAKFHSMYYILSEDAIELANNYCLYCTLNILEQE